ncbi:MAG: type I glyceraldehyde-3-phosphate dehydrogenase [Alphaproteobacteria bacterium]|nr:type I glyceraldehyde-3-phosphate dehydrogenase [Alphaproteobacteria bacterium]
MAVRVAINGFGRIGRLVLRAAYEQGRRDITFVAINDLGSVETNAHLLRHDSIHGAFPGTVRSGKSWIDLGAKSKIGRRIKVFAERDPADLPWGDLNIDVVLECTGIFASKEAASKHLAGGAKKVLISAPATGADLTVVQGVNENKLRKSHKVVSNASCTTNCLAPVAAVLDKTIGIKHGFMTTVHSYTGDQPVLDTLHKDLHRARGAATSMIPTSTGAARAVGLVLPQLAGKLDGTSVRVPTANVSMIDLVVEAKRNTTVEEVNAVIVKAASSKQLKGILVTNDEPLVSVDFNHNPASSVFDLTQTQVTDRRLVRVLSWYDNEWGFSSRMSDTAVQMGRLG